MWVAFLKDGRKFSEKDMYWVDLLKLDGVVIERLQMTDEENETTYCELSGADSYFYFKEAMFIIASGDSKQVAEVIGGLYGSGGCFKEHRIDFLRSALLTSEKDIKEYKYSREILVPGK